MNWKVSKNNLNSNLFLEVMFHEFTYTFNLRTKRNLEINELTELINKNMVHIMNPINYGNGKIINTNLSLKMQ